MKCLTCGTDTSNPKFCSRSCAAKYNNRTRLRKRKNYYCLVCNTPVPHRRKYCDEHNPLVVDWSKKTISAMRHMPTWYIHARIRQLARSVYERSGKPKRCFFCGYTKYVEICHIEQIQDFPENAPISVINSADNLVALCPNHHWEVDHGLLSFS
jgi:predicted nucleic acid-binding Zn ribbon protein